MSNVNVDPNVVKEKGNACVKEGKYEEAVLHYSHAIKLDETNASLYSNRSLAFLRMQQYYFAIEDANEAIRLRPDWAKGYFRKAEVESQTFHFSDALLSYKIALTMQPDDPSLKAALEKTKHELRKDKQADDQIPWLGAAIGIIVGVSVVIADHVFAKAPMLAHPLAMALVTISIAMVGYAISKGFRYYVKYQRTALLDMPLDLFKEKQGKQDEETEEKERENRHRYSRAQARQRFKKGRS